MKIYKIIDEYSGKNALIAYLCYYERSKAFAIEITPEISPKELPLFFYSFAKKGILSVDTEWSKRWVMERIVPEDRQNLGVILRDNHLIDYDPLKLLLKGHGRCSQDECAVCEADVQDRALWLAERMSKKLSQVSPLKDMRILLAFNDGSVRIVDLYDRVSEDRRFKVLENNRALYGSVKLQPGGNGICWNEWLFMPAAELYEEGDPVALSAEEIRNIVEKDMMDTADVCEELKCTRQYADKLVKEGRLRPIRGSGKARLYHRSDVERLKW